MQDSFDARMQGQAPASVKPVKSSKGWMVCSIILIILLIGVCVFGGMIIMKGDRDSKRLADVESQLKEKEAKIEELEKAKQTDKQNTTDPIVIDYAGLKKLTATDSNKATLSLGKLEFTKDGKYIYAIGSVSSEGASYTGTWYKSVEKGAGWKLLQSGQALGDCSNLSDEAKTFMKEYKYIDDDLLSRYIGCTQADGSVFPE